MYKELIKDIVSIIKVNDLSSDKIESETEYSNSFYITSKNTICRTSYNFDKNRDNDKHYNVYCNLELLSAIAKFALSLVKDNSKCETWKEEIIRRVYQILLDDLNFFIEKT